MIVSLKQKEIKFKTRVKLNRNICTKVRVFFPFKIFLFFHPQSTNHCLHKRSMKTLCQISQVWIGKPVHISGVINPHRDNDNNNNNNNNNNFFKINDTKLYS